MTAGMPSLMTNPFLSTPSARRATVSCSYCSMYSQFLSTPSARRATLNCPTTGRRRKFLSTPSARRATALHHGEARALGISIHALREEGDPALRS